MKSNNELALLNFSNSSRLNIIFQAEESECGLACLAMIANYYGYKTDIRELRSKYKVSSHGMNLSQLTNISSKIGFVHRPLKLELNEINQLSLPCIIHWDFNHFVVLSAVHEKKVKIYDPGLGVRYVTKDDLSKHFTGVALELSPSPDFEKKEHKNKVSALSILNSSKGIISSLGYILLISLILQLFSAQQGP